MYLYEWAMQLHGRSGIGMGGIAPLSYTTIADWARLTQTDIEPNETEALIAIDSVLLSPPDKKDETQNAEG